MGGCRGRPQDYSPKARLLNLMGYKLPFDRHDWVVLRQGGKEVRCAGAGVGLRMGPSKAVRVVVAGAGFCAKAPLAGTL